MCNAKASKPIWLNLKTFFPATYRLYALKHTQVLVAKFKGRYDS